MDTNGWVQHTWEDVNGWTDKLLGRLDDVPASVYGIPTGGSLVAQQVAVKTGARLLDVPDPGCLVVDDLVDSGRSVEPYTAFNEVRVLVRKPHSPPAIDPDAPTVDYWVRFPWEHESGPEDAVTRLLAWVGDDPNRDGLLDTPARVTRTLKELTAGTDVNPAELLAVTFEAGCDEMVVLTGIEFTSLCEHHLLPFTGTAAVGYIPRDGRVVGLSKLARLVDCFARRLQLQERMTQQIAEALDQALQPFGVGVLVRAKHSCMACRGVRKPTAEFVTSTLLGYFRVSEATRSEFLGLARDPK